MSNRRTQRAGGDAGFSLIETVIAMGILATGLLSLAGVFALGLGHLAGSSAALAAREKAREAVESVHTARDTKTIQWCQIRNVGAATNCADGSGGVFIADATPLRLPGPDGLVNTSDDLTEIESVRLAGPDNYLGTDDDVLQPLQSYTRQITISDIEMANGSPNPNLRRLTVTVTYQVGGSQRRYVLTTFISAIS
jgi:type II secretory pathway pseudopilin PulG